MTQLVVMMRHERPRYVTLDPASTFTIGRSSSCDIPVRDRYISRKHAELVCRHPGWILRDLESANGTWIDGQRVQGEIALEHGTRVRLGDTELEFIDAAEGTLLLDTDRDVVPSLSVAADDAERVPPGKRTLERVQTFNALVLESLEDLPHDQLSSFILDRLMRHLHPSRAAIAHLDERGEITRVESRTAEGSQAFELPISRTITRRVVDTRRAFAWHDVTADAELSRSRSLALQGVRSVACAPMISHGVTIGVLYVDYLIQQHVVDESDLLLVSQVARFAATRIENARLREDALQRRLLEEELRTAAAVQRQLLPHSAPAIRGWTVEAHSVASRGVSGDYYDFAIQSDGKLWVVIGDVSGKGINAALLMASLQASFRIFVRDDPEPAELCRRLNAAMKGLLPPSRFITLFITRLDPRTGDVEYTNAGHQPPIIVRASGPEPLDRADILLGMFESGNWETSHTRMEPGDVLLLFTDGLAEIECGDDEELGDSQLTEIARDLYRATARSAIEAIEAAIAPLDARQEHRDDLTLLAIARHA